MVGSLCRRRCSENGLGVAGGCGNELGEWFEILVTIISKALDFLIEDFIPGLE